MAVAVLTDVEARIILLICLLALGTAPARAAEQDPASCVKEIERVCARLEDKLETCLAERGDQMSASCRGQLSGALSLMKDPSGPAACIPDIERLCPKLAPDAITRCLNEKRDQFSESCQKYLQKDSLKEVVPGNNEAPALELF